MQPMKSICECCELRGYSRELCSVHMRHCGKQQPRELSEPVKVGGKLVGGVAIGMLAGVLATTAASFVGGVALFQFLFVKLVTGGGAVGGGIGLARSVKRAGQPRASVEEPKVASRISRPSSGLGRAARLHAARARMHSKD